MRLVRHLVLSLFILLSVTGCRKEVQPYFPFTPLDSLPFENSNIKMEVKDTFSFSSQVNDIHFFDAANGIAITGNERIYQTKDGGISWTIQYAPADSMPLYQLLFTDRNTGYAVGGKDQCVGTGCMLPGGIILKTIDGGTTWKTIFEKQDVEFVSISVNDKGVLFAVCNGADNQVFKSTDEGNSWTSLNLVHVPFHKITFNNNYGYCTSIGTRLLISDDDGNTWKDDSVFDVNYSADIGFKDGVGFCIAGNINVYKTSGNGNNWINKYAFGLMGFTVIAPLTANNCLVFGRGDYSGGDFGYSGGGVWQTTDGGNNWASAQFKNITAVNCTSFYTAANGYAVAGNKLLNITVK